MQLKVYTIKLMIIIINENDQWSIFTNGFMYFLK